MVNISHITILLIAGLVSTLMPGLIGVHADLRDIRSGMLSIFALIILLLSVTFADLIQKR